MAIRWVVSETMESSGRESVFSDDFIIESLNKNFIPVVDNVSKSQHRQDEAR